MTHDDMPNPMQDAINWLKDHGWVEGTASDTWGRWYHGPLPLILVCSEQDGTWGDFTGQTDEPRHGWHNSPGQAFHVSYRKLIEEKAYYGRVRGLRE